MKNSTTVAALSLIALSAIALTGCSGINDQLHHEVSNEFTSTGDVTKNWDKSAPWLPADATQITTRESTDGAPAILSAKTRTELDALLCTEIDRKSAPVFTQAWSPKNPFVDRAYACGNWDVIKTTGGWFGWTPNDPDEEALSPKH